MSPNEKLDRKRRKLARKPRRQGFGWADLLDRVFAVDAFQGKRCGGRLHLRSVAPRWFGPLLTLASVLPTRLLDLVLSRMLGLHLLGGGPRP